jgi:hypothetical protein
VLSKGSRSDNVVFSKAVGRGLGIVLLERDGWVYVPIVMWNLGLNGRSFNGSSLLRSKLGSGSMARYGSSREGFWFGDGAALGVCLV